MVAKVARRTFRSMWVGRTEESEEHLVVNEIGHIVRVRSVRRCVENQKCVQALSKNERFNNKFLKYTGWMEREV